MTTALVPFSALTPDAFLRVFNRLVVALGGREDDSGVTQDVYFDALKDLPVEALEDGAMALMKEPGRKWFPTTAEWRTAATQARTQAVRTAASKARTEPWHYECEGCLDVGWRYHECDGGERGMCGRRKKHGAHTYVDPCPCRPMNRTWQRHQQAGGGAS